MVPDEYRGRRGGSKEDALVDPLSMKHERLMEMIAEAVVDVAARERFVGFHGQDNLIELLQDLLIRPSLSELAFSIVRAHNNEQELLRSGSRRVRLSSIPRR